MSIYEFNPDDAMRFARDQGIQVKERGDELIFAKCPYCGRGTTKKYKFAINLKTGAFNCLRASCGAKGNMLTLARDFDFSLGSEADEYYNQRRKFKSIRHYPVPQSKPEAVAYLEGRGISATITESYKITVRKDDSKVLVFPFYDEKGALQFIKYRNTAPKDGQSKEWCEAGTKPILFGMDHCNADESDTLIMTEGQIDSLSVCEAFDGEVNAVSVPTGAKGFTWVPYCWDFLSSFKTLVVFGDHEHGKITLLEEMARRFHGNVKHVRPEDYKDCKDANELLQKYGKAAVADAVENAVMVANPKIVELKSVERKNLAELERFDSGIGQLDKLTGGFYMGQLIVLTGERGNGKSTLAAQFGAFGLKAGYNVMFYSGELLDWFFKDWFDRNIAGDRFIRSDATRWGNYSYTVRPSALDSIENWYSGKAFLYANEVSKADDADSESNESIIKTIEDGIKQYDCKVIVIDNLMTAMIDDMVSDQYRQQTQFAKDIVRIAKKYNVLVILVAHPRKQASGTTKDINNDDIAGSANITNLADMVMSYERPKKTDEMTQAAPDDDMRLLRLLKNRLNGNLERDGIKLYFQQSSKRISESRTFDWLYGWESDGANGWIGMTDDLDEIPFD